MQINQEYTIIRSLQKARSEDKEFEEEKEDKNDALVNAGDKETDEDIRIYIYTKNIETQ